MQINTKIAAGSPDRIGTGLAVVSLNELEKQAIVETLARTGNNREKAANNRVARNRAGIHNTDKDYSSALTGGYPVKKIIDNFIHSVLKAEEDMQRRWVDNRLTVACKYGFTLIYKEIIISLKE